MPSAGRPPAANSWCVYNCDSQRPPSFSHGCPSCFPRGVPFPFLPSPTSAHDVRVKLSRTLLSQAVACQARSKAAASATVTAAPATEPATAPAPGGGLSPAEDAEQRDRRDASTSYGGPNGSANGSRPGGVPSADSGPRHTVRLARGQRPGARQLPDSLRAGVGMAGVPVDGANRYGIVDTRTHLCSHPMHTPRAHSQNVSVWQTFDIWERSISGNRR